MSRELSGMSRQSSAESRTGPAEPPPSKPRLIEDRTEREVPKIPFLSPKEAFLAATASISPTAVKGVTVEELKSAMKEENGRERLKRHRTEMAGRVWIPDIWGQEELLKDWVDCSVFDSPLVSGKILSARAALVNEGNRASRSGLRIENRC